MHIKKLGTTRSYRELCGQFLCDGAKLLEEAVKSGAKITEVLTASRLTMTLPAETRVFFTARDLIDSLSPLKNAQEVLFTCKMPQKKALTNIIGTNILLDGVQDPGNVGSIIRAAYAFNIQTVILTGGCADPYNPKTIRATMGAIFRQRVCDAAFSELASLRRKGVRFVGAAPDDACRDISDVQLGNSVVALGSEGRGLSEQVSGLCSEKFKIPTQPECESLNVATAAAIIMWESTSASSG